MQNVKSNLGKNNYSKATKISGRGQPISIILSTNTQTLQTTKIKNIGSATFIGKSVLEVLTKLTCALGEFAPCAKTVTLFRNCLIYNDQ